MVFAGGGDGTIGEVANGLVGTDTILAPVPMGTANSFAKELRLPIPTYFDRHRLLEANQRLANGKIIAVDVGFNKNVGENGRYWLLWSGLGADSFLIHALEPRPAWSRRLGRVGYAIQGLAALPQFKSLIARVEVDDQVVEEEAVLVEITNCRFYAGMLPLNPNSKLDDGEYEIRIFRGRGMPQTLTYIAQLLQNQDLSTEKVITLKGKSARIDTTPQIGCHTDGDPAGHTPLVSSLCHRALRLLVPDCAPADLFLQDGIDFT